MSRLDNKIAFITGAAKGIGAETAILLSQAGALVFVADILKEEGYGVVKRIKKSGGNAHFIELDVTKELQWLAAMKFVKSKTGRLDIMVNNAGVELVKPIEELTLKEWNWISSINLSGVFLGTKYASLFMRKKVDGISQGGSIINLSSTAGLVGTAFQSAYNMTKGGVRLFSKSAALEFAALNYNIRVNSVHPSLVKTTLGERVIQELSKLNKIEKNDMENRSISAQPLGWGTVKDVAKAILFLASDDSRFITGTEMVVDGGLTAQ